MKWWLSRYERSFRRFVETKVSIESVRTSARRKCGIAHYALLFGDSGESVNPSAHHFRSNISLKKVFDFTLQMTFQTGKSATSSPTTYSLVTGYPTTDVIRWNMRGYSLNAPKITRKSRKVYEQCKLLLFKIKIKIIDG